MLEVDPEVASKIQARARERGVSVDVYLQELNDQKETDSESSKWLRKSEFTGCESGPPVTVLTRPFFLTIQLAERASTAGAASVLLLGKKYWRHCGLHSERWTTKPLLYI